MKLAKNQAKAKETRRLDLFCFRFLLSRYHRKVIGDIFKNVQKTSYDVYMINDN